MKPFEWRDKRTSKGVEITKRIDEKKSDVISRLSRNISKSIEYRSGETDLFDSEKLAERTIAEARLWGIDLERELGRTAKEIEQLGRKKL